MTPYKIPYTKRWVDLDVIQEIELCISGFAHYGLHRDSILFRWQNAFQDKKNELLLWQIEDEIDIYNEDDENHKNLRKEILEKIFNPFKEAWENRGNE
jgi:hypothetical protein